jgi:mannose-6-phosphate isomerase-like protein (cupin superfamily)
MDKVNLAEKFFLVVEGRMRIELRDRTIHLEPGEFFIVPWGGRAQAGGR